MFDWSNICNLRRNSEQTEFKETSTYIKQGKIIESVLMSNKIDLFKVMPKTAFFIGYFWGE